MEFFQEIQHADINASDLKVLLTVNSMPNLCASISTVKAENENEGDIYCVWGAFNIRRDVIKQGIRFSLLNCPHGLAWTITLNEQSNRIVIHCTIDETNQEKDFVDSVNLFVNDWSSGISKALQ